MSSSEQIEKFLRIIKEAKEYAYDVETDGLDWKRNRVVGYSVSDGSTSCYIPVAHTGGGNILDAHRFQQGLQDALGYRSGVVIGHNLKFDVLFSRNHGIDLDGQSLVCTMVQQALIDEHSPSFALGKVAARYGVTPKQDVKLYEYLSQRFNVPATKDSMAHFYRLSGSDPIAVEYAAGDTLTTYELYQAQRKEIEKQELQRIAEVENKLISPLVAMERRGIAIDVSRVEQVLEETNLHIVTNRLELDDHWNTNVRSAAQLEEYFRLSSIADWPITEKGNPSFTQSYLSETDQGLKILDVKKFEHFLNAFLIPFMSKHIYNGAIHTSFNQVKNDDYGTVTGRLSSSDPNMQQISKRDREIGKLFRSMFIARPGYFLAEIDYSQAEPRLYSHYSKEPRLLQGYNATPFIDMHSIVSDMMHVNRDRAKVINLAILYMMGVAKLARSLKITEEEAYSYLIQWYNLFPFVKDWRKFATTVAEQRGFVRTILGRRRRFPDPRGAYKAPNAIIQGGSADILKYKIVEVAEYIRSLPSDTIHMLLNIHDAIVFEVQDSELGKAALAECKRIMENVNNGPFRLLVPFIGECKTGKRWSEATYG